MDRREAIKKLLGGAALMAVPKLSGKLDSVDNEDVLDALADKIAGKVLEKLEVVEEGTKGIEIKEEELDVIEPRLILPNYLPADWQWLDINTSNKVSPDWCMTYTNDTTVWRD